MGTHFFAGLNEIFGQGCVRRVKTNVVYPDGPHGIQGESSAGGVLELEGGIELKLSVLTDHVTLPVSLPSPVTRDNSEDVLLLALHLDPQPPPPGARSFSPREPIPTDRPAICSYLFWGFWGGGLTACPAAALCMPHYRTMCTSLSLWARPGCSSCMGSRASGGGV